MAEQPGNSVKSFPYCSVCYFLTHTVNGIGCREICNVVLITAVYRVKWMWHGWSCALSTKIKQDELVAAERDVDPHVNHMVLEWVFHVFFSYHEMPLWNVPKQAIVSQGSFIWTSQLVAKTSSNKFLWVEERWNFPGVDNAFVYKWNQDLLFFHLEMWIQWVVILESYKILSA